MRRFLTISLPLLAVLGACSTPPAAPPVTKAPVSPASATLASEQVRLADLFRGTPVVFTLQQDGSLRATVPRRFSFDAGAAKVKPPLAAVLDRLAKSQATTTSRLRVSAPSDPEARAPTLARDRATALRDHLVAQGLPAARIQASGTVQTELVEIVVTETR